MAEDGKSGHAHPDGRPNQGVISFICSAEPGLLGALLAGLRSAEVKFLYCGNRELRDLCVIPGEGCICPSLSPSTPLALAAGLRSCVATQVRAIRPTELFTVSSAYIPELVEHLGGFTRLEELGPLLLEGSGQAWVAPESKLSGLLPEAKQQADPAAPRIVSCRSLLGPLVEELLCCTYLTSVDLTIRCDDTASAHAFRDHFLPRLGSLRSLRSLSLDFDATMSCGPQLLVGLARMLKVFGSTATSLERLRLGYMRFSEAADDVLVEMQMGLMQMCNQATTTPNGSRYPGLKTIEVCYPQDQELGGLDAVCVALEGAVSTLQKVVVVEAWGTADGCGLESLCELLQSCPRLREVDLCGELPECFNLAEFKSNVRDKTSSEVSINVRPIPRQ
mmetsp:Transcript_84541/g.176878  ORF Transcript_84541/g.176878 Transcript_84541/m.176878 type:complete len:391 (+) Transcript_84541:64-1236(+)|eukprot:CAMPEP_0206457176 /NCGR_PEP_ID=MMETSP0324_2-20121206/22806_1 /ASSEMBLY_ACC=CAM_ASM_000836 /TAXON_ID=2866 /ORGANISM="Crypthecodinium cohnii, Strain Seligo" /LENGTH=390 /DNA_ID=CAMNT_0053928249 /DNA_START=48 /DNA_END=1220 /DNA_ORIENTATION=+